MRLVELQEIPEDEDLRRDWNRLALQMEEPEVFYTWEWANAVQRAYVKALTPLIFVAYEESTLIGLVALAQRVTGEVVFLAADTGDYCDFLSVPGMRREFVAAVFLALKNRKVRKVVLTNLPADSASLRAISEAASANGYYSHLRPAYECARVVLGVGEERMIVKQSVLAKKRLRRNMRELQKRGQVNIDHETRLNEIESLLEPFSCVHIARFLETGKISSLAYPERRKFLCELARLAGNSGWIVLSRLRVGEVTAAWHFGFRFAGRWFWYQPTVDRTYGDFSPGYCLLAKIIELSCDSPELDVVDLGLGAEGYKDRFATATRQTLFYELNNSLPMHLRAITRYKAASLATASPQIENQLRSLRSLARTVKERLKTGGLSYSIKWTSDRIRKGMSSSENILFFEWPGDGKGSASSELILHEIDSHLLGASAIRYGEDPDVLQYLTRSAQRFAAGDADGFVLMDAENPVHFCWVKEFENFHMAELDRTLQAPSDDAAMVFDCYTPSAVRGHGYFSRAIVLLANRLESQGKTAWIFGAETNEASLGGIKKTAFQYKFTLSRQTTFFKSFAKGSIPRTPQSVPKRKAVLSEHSSVNS